MKNLFILLSLVIGLTLVSETNAQTKVIFGKGASSKTMTISVPANIEKSFSVQVRKDQVINIEVSGDIGVSKTNSFPVISIIAINAAEDIDRTQDGEGYLSILTGTSGSYIFSVSNSSKRSRTFTMKVTVTNDKADFEGGEEVQ